VDGADPDAHFRLGLLALRAGRDDDAVSEYQAAIGLAPDHFLAHANLARVYDGRGQSDLAAEHYRRFLASAPQTADWAEPRRSAEARLGELVTPRGRVVPRPSPDWPSRPPRSAAGP
jgi:tetratricopeptide (TPR) repeat protein